MIAGAAACSSIKVVYDYDQQTDFTKYKTYEYYGWARESDKLMNDLDKLLKKITEKEPESQIEQKAKVEARKASTVQGYCAQFHGF